MTGTPFDRREKSIPVTLVTGSPASAVDPLQPAGDAALVELRESAHEHDPAGPGCIVCSARGNIRAVLFDLLEGARRGLRPQFSAVLVDARGIPDTDRIVDDLTPGRSPAQGLRDHAVARNFHLARIRRAE